MLQHLTPHQAAALTGHEFFPALISSPFAQGVHYAFDFAIVCSLVAAAASWMRGGKYVYHAGPSSRKSRRAGSTRATSRYPRLDSGFERRRPPGTPGLGLAAGPGGRGRDYDAVGRA